MTFAWRTCSEMRSTIVIHSALGFRKRSELQVSLGKLSAYALCRCSATISTRLNLSAGWSAWIKADPGTHARSRLLGLAVSNGRRRGIAVSRCPRRE